MLNDIYLRVVVRKPESVYSGKLALFGVNFNVFVIVCFLNELFLLHVTLEIAPETLTFHFLQPQEEYFSSRVDTIE